MTVIEYPDNSQFAEIHGGSVLPEHREQGIYSFIHEARINDAISKNIPYVAVEAGPMRQSILEKRGYIPLCKTFPLGKQF